MRFCPNFERNVLKVYLLTFHNDVFSMTIALICSFICIVHISYYLGKVSLNLRVVLSSVYLETVRLMSTSLLLCGNTFRTGRAASMGESHWVYSTHYRIIDRQRRSINALEFR